MKASKEILDGIERQFGEIAAATSNTIKGLQRLRRPGIRFSIQQQIMIRDYCDRRPIKWYKLPWLIWFYLQRARRWFGLKTKWETTGNVYVSDKEITAMKLRKLIRAMTLAAQKNETFAKILETGIDLIRETQLEIWNIRAIEQLAHENFGDNAITPPEPV